MNQVTINFIDLDGERGDMTCPCACLIEWLNFSKDRTVRDSVVSFVEHKSKMNIIDVTSWTVSE